MKLEARQSPLLFLIGAAASQPGRRPYLSMSVAAHAALIALLYYFGSYKPELRQQEAEVASSLRATHQANAAQRLQDLQTIKKLLEESADRADAAPESNPVPAASPQTPEEMVKKARELSKEIDAIDKDIRAKEEAELLGVPKPAASARPQDARPQDTKPQDAKPPTPEASSAEATTAAASQPGAGKASAGVREPVTQEPVTQEQAAGEIASIEAKGRATLAKRLQRLQAKANGVPVETAASGASGEGDAGAAASAPPANTVRARMADFISAGKRIDQASSSQKYWGNDFFDRGKSTIPPVDASSMVPGRGRMLGAGGEYANRVYLNTWYLIGPFPGRHEGGLFDNPSYPPEKAVLLDAVYSGKDNRLLKWRYVSAQSYPLVPPDMVPDSVYYGYTEVFVDQARDLTAWIGADDDVQVYLNDRLVWRGGNVNKQSYFDAIFKDGTDYLRDYNRTEGKRVLHFEKGRNKIFFKLSNGPNSAFLSMVLTP